MDYSFIEYIILPLADSLVLFIAAFVLNLFKMQM